MDNIQHYKIKDNVSAGNIMQCVAYIKIFQLIKFIKYTKKYKMQK